MHRLFADLLSNGSSSLEWGVCLALKKLSGEDDINEALLSLKVEKIEEPDKLLPLLRFLCLEHETKPSPKAIEALLDWLRPFILVSNEEDDVYRFFTDLYKANKDTLSGSLSNKFFDISKALEDKNVTMLKPAPTYQKKKKQKKSADSHTESLLEAPYEGIIQRLKEYRKQENQYAIKAEEAKAQKKEAGNWLTKTYYKSKKAYYDSKSEKRIKNRKVAKVLVNRLESNEEITRSTFFRKDICRENGKLKGHKVHSNELNSIFKSAKKIHNAQNKSGIFSCCK